MRWLALKPPIQRQKAISGKNYTGKLPTAWTV
jgi:hypothetical protein